MTTSTSIPPTVLAPALERPRSSRLHHLAGALCGAYCALGAAGALGVPSEWLVGLLITSALLFAIAAVVALHGRTTVSASTMVLWALAFRLPFLFSTPVLSDDVWRYLWDGKVARAGINPFAYAPDDPALSSLRDEIWTHVNHRSIPTIYPPYAQMLFRLASALGGLGAWKVVVLTADLTTLAGLMVGSRGRERPAALVLLYAWNPLVLVEFAWSAHVDAVAVALTTWTIVAASNRRGRAALALASVGAWVKLFPALLVPLLVDRVANRRMLWVPIVVSVAGFLPYLSSGVPAWFGGIGAYARGWEFNGAPYLVLRELIHDPRTCRLLLGAVLGAFVLRSRSQRGDPASSALAVVAACVALSPTVHPWYVTWPLPAAVLAKRPPRLACLVATLVVPISYVVLVVREATGEWMLPVPWLALEWSAVMLAFAAECSIHRRRS